MPRQTSHSARRVARAPLDTSEEAFAVQTRAWRRLGPDGRMLAALEMSDGVRQIALGGIEERHPEYSAEEARLALFRLLHGDDLFRKAWPGRPLLRP